MGRLDQKGIREMSFLVTSALGVPKKRPQGERVAQINNERDNLQGCTEWVQPCLQRGVERKVMGQLRSCQNPLHRIVNDFVSTVLVEDFMKQIAVNLHLLVFGCCSLEKVVGILNRN